MTSRRRLDQNLRQVRYDIAQMGTLVERAVERAYRALRLHDTILAQSVIESDEGIDKRRYHIEKFVTTTLALHLPRSRDQRVLIASLMVATDLERMADHATGIARSVLRAETQIAAAAYPQQLSDMSQLVRRMILDGATAFTEENAVEAEQVAYRDHNVDALYFDLFNQLISQMRDGEVTIQRGTFFLWAGHSMERIGDHVTNVCERIVYVTTGEIVNFNRKAPDA